MNPRFSTFGIIVVAILFWLTAQNGSPSIRSIINRFLGVLLLSMILLNFNKIKPIFFKTESVTVNHSGGGGGGMVP